MKKHDRGLIIEKEVKEGEKEVVGRWRGRVKKGSNGICKNGSK